MTMKTYFQLALAGACVLSACQAPGTTAASGAGIAVRSVLSGIVAQGGGNIISGNGSAIISTNGGGIISTNGGGVAPGHFYRVRSVPTSPLAGAKVSLCDATGTPIPGAPTTTTDGEGRYSFKDIPSGYSFQVVVEAPTTTGKTARMQTLARTMEAGAEADVSPASALVTSVLVRKLGSAELGRFDPADFRTCVESTDRNLTADKLPDFSNPDEVNAKMEALVGQVAELKAALEKVSQELLEAKATIAELRAEIERLKQGTPTGAPIDGTPATSSPQPMPAPSTPGRLPPSPGQPAILGPTPKPSPVVNCGVRPSVTIRLTWNGAGSPLYLRFLLAGTKDVVQQGIGGTAYPTVVNLPFGCPMDIEAEDSKHTLLGTKAGWVIPVDQDPSQAIELTMP
jgi:hypothetical protein